MNSGWRPRLFLVLPVWLLLALLAASVSGAVETVVVDGVPHLRNGMVPGGGVRTLRLEEAWRAGGEDDEVFFGVIADVVADAEGNIYLLDRQLCQVFIYSPDGDLLRTLCREGDGPGEIRQPTDLLWMPAGMLGIIHRPPGEIVQVDTAGNPHSSFVVRGSDGEALSFGRLRNGAFRGGTLILCGEEWKFEEGRQIRNRFLSIFAADGRESHRLLFRPPGFDFEHRRYIELDEPQLCKTS